MECLPPSTIAINGLGPLIRSFLTDKLQLSVPNSDEWRAMVLGDFEQHILRGVFVDSSNKSFFASQVTLQVLVSQNHKALRRKPGGV